MNKIMSQNTPIYNLAKELNIESNRIILACKKLGINAKGATKRLNKEEIEKVKFYFESGKNVSEEIVDINKKFSNAKQKQKNTNLKNIHYFPNRLTAKY